MEEHGLVVYADAPLPDFLCGHGFLSPFAFEAAVRDWDTDSGKRADR